MKSISFESVWNNVYKMTTLFTVQPCVLLKLAIWLPWLRHFPNTYLSISYFLIFSRFSSEKRVFIQNLLFLCIVDFFGVNNSRSSWTVLQLHFVCQALLETSVDDMVPMSKIHWSKLEANFDIETFLNVKIIHKYEKKAIRKIIRSKRKPNGKFC